MFVRQIDSTIMETHAYRKMIAVKSGVCYRFLGAKTNLRSRCPQTTMAIRACNLSSHATGQT